MSANQYDMIIIGGGATGSGIALDAASRGLKAILFEMNDFAEGTSSRSTKLVHGGVRYLEKAVKQLNINQFNLVKEGLKERAILLENAPHLCSKLTLVTPLYHWWEVPYIFAGLSLYDFVSGSRGLGRSSIVSKSNLIKRFPIIKKEGLAGGVKYYDGAFNDSRLVISLLQTAQKFGATCKNYHEVTGFVYDENAKVCGVEVKDKINNQTSIYKAKSIISAAGVFADNIGKLDNKKAKNMLDLSTGIHIILDKKYLPNDEGLMIPKTEDGRVLFILPWMGKCLVGTTDEPTALQTHPKVEDKDIEYLLRHLRKYFDLDITRDDVLSSWSGIRPLVMPQESDNTANIVREHEIRQSDSGLISIIGGKWTTYRKMAEQLVDFACKHRNIPASSCPTEKLKLHGSENLDKDFLSKKVDKKTSTYLLYQYGDQVDAVLDCVEKIEFLKDDYSYTNAELIYTIRHEFVQKPMDFLARRCNAALIDKKAAIGLVDIVVDTMALELGWDSKRAMSEKNEALALLNTSI